LLLWVHGVVSHACSMRDLIMRERTPRSFMLYAVYSYRSGLSYRCVEGVIVHLASRRWTTVVKWVQRLGGLCRSLFARRGRVALVDEGQVEIGSEQWWFWLAMEPGERCILHLWLSAHRNGLVDYCFLRELRGRCGVRYVLTDGATSIPGPATNSG